MSINWFPGHMHKAIKDIKDILPKVDLIIEIVDARIPYSSSNPVIEHFRGDKPCIKLMSKSDLADPAVTLQWLAHFQQDPKVRAYATSTEQPEQIRGLAGTIRKMLAGKEDHLGNVTVLITGIPNVGKSTVINILAGRVIAKTGNEPAITKAQQRIDLQNGIILIDSPGILWPKIHNPNSGYRLALTGAIKDTAIDHDDIAFYGVDYFLKHYPGLLRQRFQLEHLPATELELLEIVGRQRGCLGTGGRVDIKKVSSVLLNEYRTATLGQISLETPEMMLAEEAVVQQALAEKAAAEAEKKQQRKTAFRKRQQ